jgi:hypothetical protein
VDIRALEQRAKALGGSHEGSCLSEGAESRYAPRDRFGPQVLQGAEGELATEGELGVRDGCQLAHHGVEAVEIHFDETVTSRPLSIATEASDDPELDRVYAHQKAF